MTAREVLAKNKARRAAEKATFDAELIAAGIDPAELEAEADRIIDERNKARMERLRQKVRQAELAAATDEEIFAGFAALVKK